MQSEHENYYQLRANQERALAEKTEDPVVARIHQQLAQTYEELLADGVFPPPVRTESKAREIPSY